MPNRLLPEVTGVFLFLPPLIGAFFGAQYAVKQTLREQAFALVLSYGMGWLGGAAVGEHFDLGIYVTGGIMFSIAAIGREVVAYVISALREGSADPSGTARKWMDLVLGRRPS